MAIRTRFFRLLCRFLLLIHMNPGALVTDIGHLKEIGIESHFTDRVSKKRLMGPRCAGGHHDTVQVEFLHPLLDQFQGVCRTGVDRIFSMDHSWKGFCKFNDFFHIHGSSDIRSTTADKGSNSWLFIRREPLFPEDIPSFEPVFPELLQ